MSRCASRVPVGLASGPAKKDVGGRLHQPLTFHHPLAGGVVAALGQVPLEDGGGGLLDITAGSSRSSGISVLVMSGGLTTRR